MIKIEKDKYGPTIRYKVQPHKGRLTWKVAEWKVLSDYRKDPTPFQNGKYNFPSLHKYDQYRKALEGEQGPKCCFCEKPIEGGEIEHFRPKKAWQQNIGDPLERPGYFWLAYRWSNLLISCRECNQSGRKGNRFPITGIRALHPKNNLELEGKILINPAEEDPSQFISFNEDIPVGVDANGRGDDNIALFELKNRADLKSIRRDKFDLYQTNSLLLKMDEVNEKAKRKASDILKRATRNKQPFSGMIRANIKKGLL